jgi:hypothetical protein
VLPQRLTVSVRNAAESKDRGGSTHDDDGDGGGDGHGSGKGDGKGSDKGGGGHTRTDPSGISSPIKLDNFPILKMDSQTTKGLAADQWAHDAVSSVQTEFSSMDSIKG